MSEKLKVLIVATEVNPYAKSGGLGDVIGSLPKELLAKGVDVRVVFPKYKTINDDLIKDVVNVGSAEVSLNNNKSGCAYFYLNNEVPIYMVEHHHYFSRDGLYGYGDDHERFAFFTKAVLDMLPIVEFQPDIINFNDWQTALGPLYLKDFYSGFTFYNKIKSIFTIHNIQYQGVFGSHVLDSIGLNYGYNTIDKLEFYGAINFMKAGILYADKITTVSATYANEIQTEQYGYGLHNVLRERSYKICGIINGIDTVANDPKTDKYLYKNFDEDTLYIKNENKKNLQETLFLEVREDVPVVAIISRLVDQKGLDLIASAMESMMNYDVQLVVLGTGDRRYEDMFKHFAYRYAGKVSANIYFSEEMAHKIYASADFFLMPSLFEPCGLGQLFAMRYGTIPIVRNTGGLSDTVTHYNYDTRVGNGFRFDDYDINGLMWCFNEAIHSYYTDHLDTIRRNAMRLDSSWENSANRYIELYNEVKNLY